MNLIGSLFFLIPLVMIVGAPASFYNTAFGTPATDSQPPSKTITGSTGERNEISSALESIIATLPLNLDTSQGPFYSETINKEAASYLSERLSLEMLSGMGAIRLPNSTEMVNFTSTGTEITDSARSAVVSNETIALESRADSAHVSMFQFAHYRSDDGIERKAVIAIFSTNSTGTLAALDGTVGIGESELTEGGDVQVKLWPMT